MRTAESIGVFTAIILIGLLDYATGPYISLAILYLLVVLWAAWRINAQTAYAAVAASGVISFATLLIDPIPIPIGLFNISARVMIFLIVAYLGSRLLETIALERRQRAELEEANRQKNLFLGMAAHDLRNPIGVIKMGSSLLMQGKPDDQEQRLQLAKSIHDSSGFMLRLVDDLLDVSKIESGNLTLKKADVGYVAFVRGTVHAAETFASPKSITIKTTFPEEFTLHIDEDKIRQVLNNLLSNAIAYSPQGTTITVEVKRHADKITTIVTDEGPGIAKEEAKRIFHAFTGGKAKGTAGEKSTGLGLAIAKRIIESHGGEIGVKANRNGSTFHFTLPAQRS